MKPWQALPRRTFLRGLGTTIALPLLEGMLPADGGAVARAAESAIDAQGAPLRMAFLYVPNGAHMPDWTPTGEGAQFELSPTLAPLEDFREDVLILSGLAQEKANANGDGPGDHARAAATFLTGAQAVKTDGRDIRAGQSVDQLAAAHLGRTTRLPSLELGCQWGAASGGCDSGYSCAYSNNISWRTATTPATKEVNPRLVFERLFGGGNEAASLRSRAQRDRDRSSVLDFVAEDARRLRQQLGKSDQHKLAEYLDSVREVERRIKQPPPDDLIVDGELHPPRGIPREYGQHVRMMGDLMALAFQSDSTRICSFMLANAGSDLAYPEVEIREGHHTLSHHQNEAAKQAKIATINRFHVRLLAYILGKLKAIDEAEGSLLDHTMLVYGSGISDGNEHSHEDLPILLAGGGGGALRGGRHVRYPHRTPLTNLYLAMLETAGVPARRVGDSTAPLLGLRAS